jgi:Putative porin
VKLSIYILTTIGLLFSGSLKAQFPTNIPQQGGNGFPTSGFPNGNNQTGFPQKNPNDKNAKNANGRIGLDDSTKVIYGPTSTKYFLEEDVYNNRKRLYNIDTLMDGLHNFNFVQRYKNLYQDLGNIGTAIRPVFYKAPEQIGTLLGYDAYSLYTFKPSQVRYYNTKSPFSNIIYVPAGNDQDLLQFELSRNVDSLWNVGINVQRISGNKQLVDRTTTGDNTAISHWDFMIHSNYQTVNKKYSLLAYFNLSDHNSNDQGGLERETNPQTNDLYSYSEMLGLGGNRPLLTNASTRDKSYNLHVYHEYVGYKAFQFYQIIDYQSRKVQFIDKNFSASWQSGFYPYAYLPNGTEGYNYLKDATRINQLNIASKLVLDSLSNESQFSNLEFKSGVKGFYKGFNYRLHVRTRFFGYTNPLKTSFSRNNENETFLGLWLNQYFKDSTRFFGEFEKSINTKDFRLNGEFQGKWLNVGGNYLSSSPTFVQQLTYNNGFRWQKAIDDVKKDSLVNVVSTNIFAYTTLKFKKLIFRPSIELTNVSSYIYYDAFSFVKQAKEPINIYKIGFELDFKKGKFSTSNQIYLTTKSDENAPIRLPPFFFNSRIGYDLLYKKKLYIQTGVELHYKSRFFADAYMPAIQQFHLQNLQEVEGYLQVDVFADMRINRVRLFLKMSHVNQGLGGNGYYVSPGFAGMGRTFNFGVHWLLFD